MMDGVNVDRFERFVAIDFERDELTIYRDRYPGHASVSIVRVFNG